MKEVIRSADPRIAALIARQATQSRDSDQLGLERVAALLDRLGRPQNCLPPVIHVAGTNGKGSTIAFLRAGLEAAGHRVHTFTSPHLVRYNERIRLAGTLIDDDRLDRLMGQVLDANDGIGASLFEVNTAMAFLAFNEVPADVVLLEVGLGGRLDATNIVERPLVTAIASLGLDHAQFLGDTIEQVAAEKAGIAKLGVPLVCLAQPAGAETVIVDKAAEAGAPLFLEGRGWELDATLIPTLPGAHQLRNANLAWRILTAQSVLEVPIADFRAGLANASWPARLQQLHAGPLVDVLPCGSQLWVDGGHNPDAAALVAMHARTEWTDDLPLAILFASLASKDAVGVLRPFIGLADQVVTLPIEGHDCRNPADLAVMARQLGFDASPRGGISGALSAVTAPSRVLIFGSLYLAGEALALNGTIPD
jgi:dihydrofolate synthase/folylpolyglutamate synthase